MGINGGRGINSGLVLGGSGINIAGGGFVGLLDTYGGAAAAYSVRRLSSTYTGALIEVRRSSDNTTQDIGYNANGDLDTTALINFVTENGSAPSGNGFVRTWYDQSGNGNNAQQTTTTNQPQIVSSGSLIELNSKPSLEWDGTADFFNCGTALSKPSNYTTFSVFNTDNTNNQVLYGDANSGASSSTTGMLLYLFSSVFRTNFGDGSNFRIPESSESFSALTDYLLVVNYIDGNSLTSVRLNTSDLTMSSAAGTATSIGGTAYNFSIGRFGEFNGVYFNGKANEFIFYHTNESSNIDGIETNINNYYSIY